ncbi:hypothetical protein HanXRQr2_Chr11g0483031 [Helianthus annuus]|uniref:Reverse transcriptase domain, Reverse transcriptase zinc-binding domain protein n=1 Tax=Helianthus annuus TaxID=4232 RepID=A0A9K3HN75_HELAN|nr:hypothetical protein HanXRQr2_Chr11g0483031 [Helianthus annuus]KAJ0874536.1 hypothetical protein HanPSC8_Chr11g0465321 [Helianthus annuus]
MKPNLSTVVMDVESKAPPEIIMIFDDDPIDITMDDDHHVINQQGQGVHLKWQRLRKKWAQDNIMDKIKDITVGDQDAGEWGVRVHVRVGIRPQGIKGTDPGGVDYPNLQTLRSETVIDDPEVTPGTAPVRGIGLRVTNIEARNDRVPWVDLVWSIIRPLADIHTSSFKIGDIMEGLLSIPNKNSVRSIIGRLLLAASSYFIWQERNARLFNSTRRLADKLGEIIVSTVRLKLASLKIKRPMTGVSLLDKWRLPMT